MNTAAADAPRRRHRQSTRAANAVRPRALWLLAALSLLVAAWLVPEAWRQLRADLSTGPARSAITRLGTPRPLVTEEDWAEALAALERSAQIAPDNGSTQTDLAALYAGASLRPGISEDQRVDYALSAQVHGEQATRLRPTDPRGWAELARARLLVGNAGPGYIQAWELAAQLGPGEAMVQGQLFDLVLATFPDPHTPDMAAWVAQLHQQANPPKREAMRRVAAGFDVSIDELGRLSALPAPPEPAASGAAAPGSPKPSG